ncbi:hypothetical protein C8Q73DRAFT_538955 [Cubamyces lactineus]|nr:hypothetical protein C8Q73DRAFT_538955 [Cubamyces lactineus]
MEGHYKVYSSQDARSTAAMYTAPSPPRLDAIVPLLDSSGTQATPSPLRAHSRSRVDAQPPREVQGAHRTRLQNRTMPRREPLLRVTSQPPARPGRVAGTLTGGPKQDVCARPIAAARHGQPSERLADGWRPAPQTRASNCEPEPGGAEGAEGEEEVRRGSMGGRWKGRPPGGRGACCSAYDIPQRASARARQKRARFGRDIGLCGLCRHGCLCLPLLLVLAFIPLNRSLSSVSRFPFWSARARSGVVCMSAAATDLSLAETGSVDALVRIVVRTGS